MILNLNWVKKCSVRKFCMTLHLHDILMTCQQIIPLFDFVSHILFWKYHGKPRPHMSYFGCFWTTFVWPNTPPCMPHRRWSFHRSPCSGGMVWWPFLPGPWLPNGLAQTKLPISPHELLSPPLWNVNFPSWFPSPLMSCLIFLPPYDMPNLPHHESFDLTLLLELATESDNPSSWSWPQNPMALLLWSQPKTLQCPSLHLPLSQLMMLTLKVRLSKVSCPIHLAPYSIMDKTESILVILKEEAKEFWWGLPVKVSHT